MTDGTASPRISVVVPVYNVEKYLWVCVESILAQTFTDFELILVDDGSPDKSGELCNELAKQDSRIRVFHQENGGVTSARRLGVENARGEWITFVDSDDLLPKDTLKALIDEADDDTDWIQGIGQSFDDGTTPKAKTRTGEVKNFDLIELVENMLSSHMAPWGKLVAKKLFSPHVLDIPRAIRFREDVLMNLRIIVNNPRKPKEIDKIVYLYRKGLADSVTFSSVVTENYVLRYAQLMLAEVRIISTLSNRERLLSALSQHFCGDISYGVIGHGLPVKFPHRLATLMRRGMKAKRRYLFVYLCLCFNCLGIAYRAAKIFRILRGEKMKEKTRLEL